MPTFEKRGRGKGVRVGSSKDWLEELVFKKLACLLHICAISQTQTFLELPKKSVHPLSELSDFILTKYCLLD